MRTALESRLRKLESRLGVHACLCSQPLQLHVEVVWGDFERVTTDRLQHSLAAHEASVARPRECPVHRAALPRHRVVLRGPGRHEPAGSYYQRMAEHLAQRNAA